MIFLPYRMAQGVAIALIATVVTQLLYFGLGAAGSKVNPGIIWPLETVAFLLIAILSLPLLRFRGAVALAAAGLALGGLFNVVQLGIGLTMFEPLKALGESGAALTGAVVGLAFFHYFAGKFAFGIAALVLGMTAFARASGARKWLGLGGALTGLAALVTATVAMASGMALVFPTGAAGTAAALFAALLLPAAVLDTGGRLA